MPETIIDTLVRVLRRQAAAGTRVTPLSAATRGALFAAPAERARSASPVPAPRSVAANGANFLTAPSAADGQVGRGCQYPTPAASPARDRQSPRAARQNEEVNGVAVASPAPATLAPAALSTLDWDELQCEVRSCTRCVLCKERTQTVFGDGNRQAELMFIGEAPGRDEDAQGVPFVGAAGQLLTKMISAMQFDRSAVYIANIVKCRPPRNRTPEADEATACLPFLRRQIELVRPKVIVTLGATPLQVLLGKTGIARERGVWCEFAGIPVLPTFHPAYLLRAPEHKREAWEDLKHVMVRLGREPAVAAQRPPAAPAGG